MIVAPLTVASKGEWYKTIKEWFPRKKVVLIHKDRKNEVNEPADVYAYSPDGLKIVKDELQSMVERGIITISIFDELTVANHTYSVALLHRTSHTSVFVVGDKQGHPARLTKFMVRFCLSITVFD